MSFSSLFLDSQERSFRFNLANSYISALTFIVLSVVYLDLGNYYGALTEGAFPPKYIYFALVAAIVPLFLFRNRTIYNYLNTPYIYWTAALLILNFFHWLFLSMDGNYELAGLTLTRMQYLVLAVLFGFLLVQANPILLGKMFFLLALVLSILQLVDFFLPGNIVPLETPGAVVGRASSTLINANKAAESLIILTVLGMGVLRPHWRVWLLIVVFPGVFLTFSRSGLFAFLLVLLSCFWLKLFARSAYFVLLSFLIFILMTFVGLLDFVLSQVDSYALDNIHSRIMFFQSVDTSDSSSMERLAVAGYAVDSFLTNPLFGNGSGYTSFWGGSDQGPHNQHLLMVSEYGIVGYVLFVYLIVLLLRGKRGGVQPPAMSIVCFSVFLAFTPFTHNMFDHLYWLLTFSVMSHQSAYLNK